MENLIGLKTWSPCIEPGWAPHRFLRLWGGSQGVRGINTGRSSSSFIFLGFSQGAPFCLSLFSDSSQLHLNVTSDRSLTKGCPFLNVPVLWGTVLSGSSPWKLPFGSRPPWGLSAYWDQPLLFPRITYGLRTKTGSEAPHSIGRKLRK